MKAVDTAIVNAKTVLKSLGDQEFVIMSLTRYQALIEEIEDLRDALALKEAMETSEKLIPYSEARARLVQERILDEV